jgi:hypothetical protein
MNSHHLSLVEWKLDGETRALARADGPEPQPFQGVGVATGARSVPLPERGEAADVRVGG